MRRFNSACPTCGAATHSKEALVRSSEKSCSCDSALWVASDMPPCVGKLQEEIAALETSLAERWENLNVQDGVIDGLQEEISALRAAAIQPVMSRQGFGTPGTVEFYRCVFCNHDARTPDIDHDSDCVVREAGYLGGGE